MIGPAGFRGSASAAATLRAVAGKIALLSATLVVATFAMYALTVLVPGDPALALFRARFGESAAPDPEQLAAIRRETGFDRPIFLQYGDWLGRALRGDLGTSYTRKRPVWPTILPRLPLTLAITLGALGIALVAAVPVGLLAGRSRLATTAVLAVSQFALSIPDYVLAIGLMLMLAVKMALVPVSGTSGAGSFVLPVATLVVRPWATFTRLVMAGTATAHRSDWARTARAKGLTEATVLSRHVLPHVVLPVISLLGVSASGALAAGLVVEVIFAIPGVGRLLYEAIGERDIPTIQACLLIQVSLAVVANWLADHASRRVNPLLRCAP
ncbi:MAG: ABC transporter permease [Chloroflexota bacterium]